MAILAFFAVALRFLFEISANAFFLVSALVGLAFFLEVVLGAQEEGEGHKGASFLDFLGLLRLQRKQAASAETSIANSWKKKRGGRNTALPGRRKEVFSAAWKNKRRRGAAPHGRRKAPFLWKKNWRALKKRKACDLACTGAPFLTPGALP